MGACQPHVQGNPRKGRPQTGKAPSAGRSRPLGEWETQGPRSSGQYTLTVLPSVMPDGDSQPPECQGRENVSVALWKQLRCHLYFREQGEHALFSLRLVYASFGRPGEGWHHPDPLPLARFSFKNRIQLSVPGQHTSSISATLTYSTVC